MKIIIILLIRNNDEKKYKFLKIFNCINILLNRARYKIYIINNIYIARSVFMWNKIVTILENDENINNILTLYCFRYKEISIEILKFDDFFILSFENNCNKKYISQFEYEYIYINKYYSKLLYNVVRYLKRY